MIPDIQALVRLTAARGHRTPAGHHCHNVKALIELVPEHDNQARRRLVILAVETAGLGRAVASHDHGGVR